MAQKKQGKARPKCLTKGCGKLSHARKVCQSCLRDLNDLVASGKFTDEQLVAKGAWAPRALPGRKRLGKASKALGLS
jgi:hypothetical protein